MQGSAPMARACYHRLKHCIWQALARSTVRSNRERGLIGLVVCKLDRLARSTRDLLNTLATIGERGATFKSLADHWADTTTAHGRLMLTVSGGLAEFERHLILTR